MFKGNNAKSQQGSHSIINSWILWTFWCKERVASTISRELGFHFIRGGDHWKVSKWANNLLIFLKKEDGKETGKERKVTFVEYLLCVMGSAGCFIWVISLNMIQKTLYRWGNFHSRRLRHFCDICGGTLCFPLWAASRVGTASRTP